MTTTEAIYTEMLLRWHLLRRDRPELAGFEPEPNTVGLKWYQRIEVLHRCKAIREQVRRDFERSEKPA